jgi:sialate O-acetylesterase
MKKALILCLAALGSIASTEAKVKLPAVLGSNMVLQRNTDVNLWGTATPGKNVTITTSWQKGKYTVRADKEGRWKTTVPTIDAGGPYSITFDDGEKTVIDNILLGEVWICSGQSNMEMPVAGFMSQPVNGAEEEIMQATQYPGIRMFTVPKRTSDTPQDDCEASWNCSTPKSVRTFSAVGYFFGKELNRILNVPIGLIATDWGGTVIEAWMSQETLDGIKGRNSKVDAGYKGPNVPTVLYNGMILPICNFTAKGFIWYQGESNRSNWYDYANLQKAQIESWRKLWGDEQMPFYITQIAPYVYEGATFRSTPVFVDQQRRAADETPHCDIACTTDIGEYGIIHPAAKKQVGHRLAALALTNDYGVEGVPAFTPRFKSMEKKDGTLILSFDNITTPNNYNTDDPHSTDCFVVKGEPKGFEVAGEDKVFYPAKGKYHWSNNIITVWSDSVPNPLAVRYAYHNFTPDANVMTQTGLPLPSFRTDDWEIKDMGFK